MKTNYILFLLTFLFIAASVYPQEVDIIPYLKQIESGNKEEAEAHLARLEKSSPRDPSIKFLKGVLTEDGEEAVLIYTDILKNHPRSKYADAALYRLYSYYYALGSYETAKNYLSRLKNDYPVSPYIKIADKNIPSADETVEVHKDIAADPSAAQKNFKYTIQAGAFSNFKNAASLKADLEKSGFETEIKEKTVAGTVFRVIYVGKFETDEEAKSFLQVINNEFKLDGRVIPIN